jgi:hypothetical protein
MEDKLKNLLGHFQVFTQVLLNLKQNDCLKSVKNRLICHELKSKFYKKSIKSTSSHRIVGQRAIKCRPDIRKSKILNNKNSVEHKLAD